MKVEERFTDRVENYIKYRPHYPDEVYAYLCSENIVLPDSVIADIGCGTGISGELFLKNGHAVFGVEPNENMLNAASDYLNSYSDFVPTKANAENTSLENLSIDVIICAQAFHWFDKEKTKKEFTRILKPGGTIVLMWNDRRTNSTDFLKVYEDYLQMFATDYKKVNHKNTQEKDVFTSFFGNDLYKEQSFYNFQDLTFEGLRGRVLSASYMPNEGHADFEYMIYCLKKIFQRYQVNGRVKLEYDTKIYYGFMER